MLLVIQQCLQKRCWISEGHVGCLLLLTYQLNGVGRHLQISRKRAPRLSLTSQQIQNITLSPCCEKLVLTLAFPLNSQYDYPEKSNIPRFHTLNHSSLAPLHRRGWRPQLPRFGRLPHCCISHSINPPKSNI